MNGAVVLYTAGFLLYGTMEVLGILPQEIRSAGITLAMLFSRYYGDQHLDFIGYHVRRTTTTLALHAALPLLYSVGLVVVAPDTAESTFLSLLVLVSVLVLLAGGGLAFTWYRGVWSGHPLVRKLSQFEEPWRRVGMSVNLEYRDVDKFMSVLGSTTVIVTDSWIIQCKMHSVDIIHQRDAVLNVSSAEEHRLSMEGQSVQYLTIQVESINSKFKSFSIRLNSLQYGQLRERLQSPIRAARSIMIHQSLSDRFAAAFAEQVQRNGAYSLPQGSTPLEHCIGCMQTVAQVKLQKRCAGNEEGACRQCFCRPLWCMSCMSRWFAARQDQHRPDTWMASTAPCPMCRAQFCMLDILRVAVSS